MSKKIEVDDELIRKLADLMDETGLTEIEIGNEGHSVRVARGSGTVTYAAAPMALGAAPTGQVQEISHADHPGVVTSPMVVVTSGQVVMLIEAMKVFNQIKAPQGGKVTKILVESGSPVEFGEPLLIIE